MEESIEWWIGFGVFVVLMLLLDLFILHKEDKEVKLKEALLWSGFWILLALLFAVGVYFFLGHGKALDFITAYLLEKSLSVDNLFVFIMVFGFFNVEARYQHKVLAWGIVGALVMRLIFILSGVALLHQFSWMMYVFGAFLIYTGIKMLFGHESENKEFDPNKNAAIRWFKKVFPVTEERHGSDFFLKRGAMYYATPLFVCLLFIELSDLVFAIDSIPAVLAVSSDPFIVYTSNIFAILGLRSLYFALSGVMKYFVYLKYALAAILSFVGVKMCFNEWMKQAGSDLHIGNIASLLIIISLLAVSILASVLWGNRKEKKK